MSPLQEFGHIVAVPQDQINASLDARFPLDPKSLECNAQLDSGEKMTGTMSPPTVTLVVQFEQFKSRFSLHFVSDSFTYYTIRAVDDKPTVFTHRVSIDGWALAFAVRLGLDVVKSITSYFLDFATADLMSFNPELSKTPGLKVPLGQSPELDDKLGSFLRVYLKEVTVHDPSVANPIAPSFPPTSVQFQTTVPRGELDCFLFLQMTNHNKAPRTPIDWTWNTETGSSRRQCRQGGCMVIAKANFWDTFFVERATFLNCTALDMLNRVGWANDN
ncbi:hypothetical protein C8T65DRAFT_742368 [Cerioporus squamosus]|nr:hypothetical protein C8T65DRAFT_742368 [Cerioporus squamosus]